MPAQPVHVLLAGRSPRELQPLYDLVGLLARGLDAGAGGEGLGVDLDGRACALPGRGGAGAQLLQPGERLVLLLGQPGLVGLEPAALRDPGSFPQVAELLREAVLLRVERLEPRRGHGGRRRLRLDLAGGDPALEVLDPALGDALGDPDPLLLSQAGAVHLGEDALQPVALSDELLQLLRVAGRRLRDRSLPGRDEAIQVGDLALQTGARSIDAGPHLARRGHHLRHAVRAHRLVDPLAQRAHPGGVRPALIAGLERPDALLGVFEGQNEPALRPDLAQADGELVGVGLGGLAVAREGFHDGATGERFEVPPDGLVHVVDDFLQLDDAGLHAVAGHAADEDDEVRIQAHARRGRLAAELARERVELRAQGLAGDRPAGLARHRGGVPAHGLYGLAAGARERPLLGGGLDGRSFLDAAGEPD